MMCRFRREIWLALVLLLPSAALAQNRPPITGEGTEGFRALLRAQQLKPLESLEAFNKQNSGQVLLIAFRGVGAGGNEHFDLLGEFDDRKLRNFVAGGGAILVATDIEVAGSFNDAFGASVNPEVVRAVYQKDGFLGKQAHPYVAPVAGAIPNLFAIGAEGGGRGGTLATVATNLPAYLGPPGQLKTLGVFPARTVQRQISGRDQGLEPRPLDFAQGNEFRGGGRVLLLSDHSVFINSMLLPQNATNDNLQFAINCLNWLCVGPDGQPRTHVLFMEDGKIWKADDYNLALRQRPDLRPEDIAGFLWENKDLLWKNPEIAEELLAGLEEDKFFSILEQPDENGLSPLEAVIADLTQPWQIVKFVVILGAIVLLFLAARAFIKSKFVFSKRIPRLSTQLDRLRPMMGPLEYRLRSGVGKGQYFELARQKARDMFAELNQTPGDGMPLPEVTIQAGYWERGRIARDLRYLWEIAYGDEPTPVPAKKWDEFLKKVNKIGLMIRHGVVVFE